MPRRAFVKKAGKERKTTMKNKILIAFTAILILIPTVLMFVFYEPPFESLTEKPDMITSVQVIKPDGQTLQITDRTQTDATLKLINSEEKADSIPDDALGATMFKISLTGAGRTESYSVFMDINKLQGVYFYNDADRQAYRVQAENARNFAAFEFADFLYTSELPILSVSGKTVKPYEFEWKYKNIKNDYLDLDVAVSDTTEDIGTVSAGDLDILFSRVPLDADVYITVKEGDKNPVKRSYAEFTGVYPDSPTECEFELEAQWRESDGVNGVGSGKYRFKATVNASPDFKIWTTTLELSGQPYVEKGGIIVVAARNIDPAKLKFSSTPKLCSDPVFYTDGEVSYAVIPTTYNTEPGEYEICFEYEIKRSTYTVTVSDKEYNAKNFTFKESTIEKYINDENITSLLKLINGTTSAQSSNKWLAGNDFLFPTYRQDYKTGYGNPIHFNGEMTEYCHVGIDSRLLDDEYATAMADGKIVYAGVDAIWGGVIVIDHGLGIRSWYTRLDIEDVQVGQTVQQGQKLAKGDDSGFGDDYRMHCSVTVQGSFVSPLWLIENGIQLPNWQ